MQPTEKVRVSIPFPSRWGIHAEIAGRPMVWGVLIINSITGNRVIGTVNFRGTLIPINGYWNESAPKINCTPYSIACNRVNDKQTPNHRSTCNLSMDTPS